MAEVTYKSHQGAERTLDIEIGLSVMEGSKNGVEGIEPSRQGYAMSIRSHDSAYRDLSNTVRQAPYTAECRSRRAHPTGGASSLRRPGPRTLRRLRQRTLCAVSRFARKRLRSAADRAISASSRRIQPTKLGRAPRNCRFPCGSAATQGWEHRPPRLVFSVDRVLPSRRESPYQNKNTIKMNTLKKGA